MRYDVDVVRWVDGHRLAKTVSDIDGGEVMVLRIEEECMPGELATFIVRKHPRPWEPRASEGSGVGSGPSDAETTGRATRPFPTDRTTRRFGGNTTRRE